MLTPKNARGRPVTKLCLALESFRRTDEGRVRDATAFLGHYFPHQREAVDRLFIHMPKEVRADLLSNWGIRGKKSALRDDDERVRNTVADALAAGDIDANVIEEGVTPEILVDWAPLDDWWSFWRGPALPLGSVRKALAVARELALFDERWFFDHLRLESQRLDGTDVVCAALSKEQIVTWIQAVHASGDASPAGLVAALGWETILAKTAHEALLFSLDALAREVGLTAPRVTGETPASEEGLLATEAKPAIGSEPKATAPGDAGSPTLEAAATSPKPGPVEPRPLPTAAAAQPSSGARPGAATGTAKPATAPAAATPIAKGPPSATMPKVDPAKPPPAGPRSTPGMPAVSPAAASTANPPRTGGPAQGPGPARAAGATGPGHTPPSSRTASPQLPSVIIDESPPVSSPLTARALFGAPETPPMRPPAKTLAGVGGEIPSLTSPTAESSGTPDVPPANVTAPPPDDPAWAPPRAEPGDMGWDIVYGVKRTMSTYVQPKYNFDDDDEPTSEIQLPENRR